MKTSRKYKYKRGTIVLFKRNPQDFDIGIVKSSERKLDYFRTKSVLFQCLFTTTDVNISLESLKPYNWLGYVEVNRLEILTEEETNKLYKILVFK